MTLLAAFLLVATLQDPPQPPKSGKFRGEIVDPESKDVIMKVRMQIPDPPAAGKKWGFIFVCHGFKGSEGNSYLDGTVAALKRQGLDQDYLVVAGKSKGEGWTEEDDGRFLKLYEWAKKTYPVDPERLMLFGSSNGARFVCRFGFAHQDIVKAVVSYCGFYDFSKQPDGDKKVEWFFVHGSKDNPQQSQKMVDELKKRGYQTTFKLLEDYGHTGIWDGKDHPEAKLVDEVRDEWTKWLNGIPRK
jgi:dipeptidyl aminopeptidase/acylaminoacyl peptidase